MELAPLAAVAANSPEWWSLELEPLAVGLAEHSPEWWSLVLVPLAVAESKPG